MNDGSVLGNVQAGLRDLLTISANSKGHADLSRLTDQVGTLTQTVEALQRELAMARGEALTAARTAVPADHFLLPNLMAADVVSDLRQIGSDTVDLDKSTFLTRYKKLLSYADGTAAVGRERCKLIPRAVFEAARPVVVMLATQKFEPANINLRGILKKFAREINSAKEWLPNVGSTVKLAEVAIDTILREERQKLDSEIETRLAELVAIEEGIVRQLKEQKTRSASFEAERFALAQEERRILDLLADLEQRESSHAVAVTRLEPERQELARRLQETQALKESISADRRSLQEKHNAFQLRENEFAVRVQKVLARETSVERRERELKQAQASAQTELAREREALGKQRETNTRDDHDIALRETHLKRAQGELETRQREINSMVAQFAAERAALQRGQIALEKEYEALASAQRAFEAAVKAKEFAKPVSGGNPASAAVPVSDADAKSLAARKLKLDKVEQALHAELLKFRAAENRLKEDRQEFDEFVRNQRADIQRELQRVSAIPTQTASEAVKTVRLETLTPAEVEAMQIVVRISERKADGVIAEIQNLLAGSEASTQFLELVLPLLERFEERSISIEDGEGFEAGDDVVCLTAEEVVQALSVLETIELTYPEIKRKAVSPTRLFKFELRKVKK